MKERHKKYRKLEEVVVKGEGERRENERETC